MNVFGWVLAIPKKRSAAVTMCTIPTPKKNSSLPSQALKGYLEPLQGYFLNVWGSTEGNTLRD